MQNGENDAEVEAVESVLNMLAFAQTDSAFQKVVTRLLPALLAALSTTSARARAKCAEALTHINIRLRAMPGIVLPFEDVLVLVVNPATAAASVRAAVHGRYLARAYDTLPRARRVAALAPLVDAVPKFPDETARAAVSLLALRSLAAASADRPRSAAATDDALWRIVKMCADDAVVAFWRYLTSAVAMAHRDTNITEDMQLAAVRLAAEYAVAKQPARAARVYAIFLCAAGCASRDALVAAGEDALKKIDSCDVIAAADPTIAMRLFELCDHRTTNLEQQMVVLAKGLLNVTLCASIFPEALTVIEASIHRPGLPPRLQALGMQFASFVIKHAEEEALVANTGALASLLVDLANNETKGSPSFPDRVRAFGFTGLSELVIRLPSAMQQIRLTPRALDTTAVPDLSPAGSPSLSDSHSRPQAAERNLAPAAVAHAQSPASQRRSTPPQKSLTPQFFFDAAVAPDQPLAVRSSASHALIAMARVLNFSDPSKSAARAQVLQTLSETLRNEEDLAATARAATQHWANECFAFADCEARVLNILAADDLKQDVRQQAMAGLSPKRWRLPKADGSNGDDEKQIERPSFTALVGAFAKHVHHDLSVKILEVYLQFAFFILRNTVVSGGKLELASIVKLREHFRVHAEDMAALLELKGVADRVLLDQNSEKKRTNLEKIAISIVIFTSKVDDKAADLQNTYRNRIDDLVALTTQKSASGDVVVAHAVATLVGLASECFPKNDVFNLLKRLDDGLEPNPSGKADGRDGEDKRVAKLLCIANVILRIQARADLMLDDAGTAALSKACLHICGRLSSSVESCDIVRVAVCIALKDLGVAGPLPITAKERTDVMGALTELVKLHSTNPKVTEAAADTIGCLSVGDARTSVRKKAASALLNLCKERKEDEIRFMAAESLVRCVAGFNAPSPAALEDEDPLAPTTADLSASEGLTGVLSLRTEPFTVSRVVLDDESDVYTVSDAITGAIQLAHDERPSARAGGCVTLFTLLRLVGLKSEAGTDLDRKIFFKTDDDEKRFKEAQNMLNNKLTDIQRAFTILLGDRSEFVQQLSSCGVALVYHMCPAEKQRELVSTLVRSLTVSRSKAASTVPGDKGSLVELGGLNVDGDGGNKSATYKELCTLAQDMGQPELVYKFMDLAGHTALWNNRKGAALAGSALLGNEVAAEQLRPHVKSLLPRLYVYCYDPIESVRLAMGSVLTAVIKAGALGSVFEAVKAHFDIVTEYCLTCMTSRQWRSREAGCGALRDALASRTWNEVKDVLAELWYCVVRALDDIKESVRVAAGGTARALSELSVHLCDVGQVGVEVASGAIDVVLTAAVPGITHSVTQVSGVCSGTVMKIIRYGGEALRPFVARVIESLLEAATELEPQSLNYAQFHVDDPNELEQMRISAASTSMSPLVDGLERVCGLVDESNVEDVVQALVRLAKLGVGIPTRAATARVFASILNGRATVVSPFAARLLQSAVGACGMEQNSSLRSAWCTAAGIAAHLCNAETVGKFVDRIAEMGGSDDARRRIEAALLAQGLWRRSADTARQHGSALLPVAYMGSHEADDTSGTEGATENGGESATAAAAWRQVWDEGAPSTQAGLRVYANEITAICVQRLETSGQYRVKTGAARALGALAEAANDNVEISCLSRGGVALLKSLPGHIWEGQVVAVEALGKISAATRDTGIWEAGGGVVAVVKVLLAESRRGKSEYRLAAVDSATATLELAERSGRPVDGVLFEEVFEAVQDALRGGERNEDAGEGGSVARVVWETGSDADAVDARTRARKAAKRQRVAAMRCVSAAYAATVSGSSAEKQRQHLTQVVKVASDSSTADWDVRQAALVAAAKCISVSSATTLSAGDGALVRRFAEVIVAGAGDAKYAAVRRAAYDGVEALHDGYSRGEIAEVLLAQIRQLVLAARVGESDADAQTAAKRVAALMAWT